MDQARQKRIGANLAWPATAMLLATSPCYLSAQTPGPPAPAPVSLKSLTLEELSQIDVTTVSKRAQSAFQTPAAVFVITGEDIHRSGVTSIPEALRLAPGVEVARIDSNKWSIGIRGFGTRFSRSVLVLIDGRTVYTPLFAGTFWEVQDTLLEDVDRIEVIRGPGGTIWGPNAVNGVISIITKNSSETRGELVSAGGGNYDQGFLNFRYGAGNDRGLSYRIYGKAFTRAPELHPDHGNFDDWRAAQAGFRADWARTGRDNLTIQGDLYKEEAGERMDVVTYAPPYNNIVDSNAQLGGGNIMARWERTLAGGGDIEVQGYYDRTSRLESNLSDKRSTFDLDFVERFPVSARQRLSWGLGVRVSPVRNDQIAPGLFFLPNKRTDQLYTGFAQDEITLVDNKLTLTLGSKLLRTNFTGLEGEPSVRLAWTPGDRRTFWAAFTHAVRTPSDAEEDFYAAGLVGFASNGIPEFARFNANNSFTPEQMNGYEAGYRQLVGTKVLVDVAAFYNHYHNLLDQEYAGALSLETDPAPAHYILPARLGNGLYGYTKGFEIAPEWRPTSMWRLRGSYSFLHMNIGPSPGSGDQNTSPGIVGSSPAHEVSARSSLDISKVLQLDLSYRYVSALPGQATPAYSTGDVRFSWKPKRDLEMEIVGNNLFQPAHPEYAESPGNLVLVGIRRSGFLRLTWSH